MRRDYRGAPAPHHHTFGVPGVAPVGRIAGGDWPQWGRSIQVQAGDAIPKTELIRTSVGYPVPWVWQVWLDGGGAGAWGGGVDLPIMAGPGMGAGGSRYGQPYSIKPGGAFLTQGSGPTPATELLITVEPPEASPIIALVTITICAVACPASNWLPKGIGNGPQW